MLAVEDRLDTGIFVVGGLPPIDLPRSWDIALYAQRVKAPVLMVNGSEDVLMPLKTTQIPLYELGNSQRTQGTQALSGRTWDVWVVLAANPRRRPRVARSVSRACRVDTVYRN